MSIFLSGRSSSHGLLPVSPSPPEIVVEMVGSTVYLKCAFDPPPTNSSLGFIIRWSRLSAHGAKEELRQEAIIQSFSTIELDGINVRLGDRVRIFFFLLYLFYRGSFVLQDTCGDNKGKVDFGQNQG